MHCTCFPDRELCPAKDAPYEDHRVFALECRVFDGIKVPVDVPVQVAHIDR